MAASTASFRDSGQALALGNLSYPSSERLVPIVRSLSAKYRPDRYRRDKSVKFGTELP